MPLSPRNKQFVIIGIIAAVVIVGGWLGYDQYQRVAEQQKNVNAAETKLEGEEKELANLKQLSQTLDEMSIEMGNVRQVLPAGVTVPELLVNLEAIALNSEVTFNSIAISDQATASVTVEETEESDVPEGVKKLSFTISVTGAYKNMKRYLDGVEKNLRLIDVKSVSGEDGLYSISMNAYYVE